MASNDDKKKAREILAANPDMKYTEALRSVQQGRNALTGVLALRLGMHPHDPNRAVHVMCSRASNLAMLGSPKSGQTAVLRHLALDALEKGWRVSIAYSRHGQYRELGAEGHVDAPTPREGSTDEADSRDFLATLTPGNESQPHLVIIDNGDYLFVPEHGREDLLDEEWATNLEALLSSPYTAVAVQSQTFRRADYPHRIMRHFNERLVLGRHPMRRLVSFFGDVVPAAKATETLDLDAGEGLVWDSDRLTPVRPDKSPLPFVRMADLYEGSREFPEDGGSAFLRYGDLPEGLLDPFRIASELAATGEDVHVPVTTTTGPSLTVRSPNRVPTSPVFDLRLMDDLAETTADQTPFMLKVTQNMLLTSPSGVGGVAARHLLAAWLDEQGVYVDLIGADDPIPGFGGRYLDPDQAAPFLASVEGAHAVILNRPEEFEDPDAWWAAVAPLLDRPRTAVIVHTADPAAIPGEVRRSLAVRAGMGLHLMDKDDVELAMGEGLAESELEKASSRGRMLVRQGDECTVLMIDQRR